MLSQAIATIWKFDNPIAMLDQIDKFERYIVKHSEAGDGLGDNISCPVCGCKTVRVKSYVSHNRFCSIISKDLPGSVVHGGYVCILCRSAVFISSRKTLHETHVSFTVLRETKPVLRFTFGSSRLECLTDLYSRFLAEVA